MEGWGGGLGRGEGGKDTGPHWSEEEGPGSPSPRHPVRVMSVELLPGLGRKPRSLASLEVLPQCGLPELPHCPISDCLDPPWEALTPLLTFDIHQTSPCNRK